MAGEAPQALPGEQQVRFFSDDRSYLRVKLLLLLLLYLAGSVRW